MEPKRTTDPGQDDPRPHRAVRPNRKPLEASPQSKRGDEAEGQLGPDELPDPSEVIMNQEAKLHH